MVFACQYSTVSMYGQYRKYTQYIYRYTETCSHVDPNLIYSKNHLKHHVIFVFGLFFTAGCLSMLREVDATEVPFAWTGPAMWWWCPAATSLRAIVAARNWRNLEEVQQQQQQQQQQSCSSHSLTKAFSNKASSANMVKHSWCGLVRRLKIMNILLEGNEPAEVSQVSIYGINLNDYWNMGWYYKSLVVYLRNNFWGTDPWGLFNNKKSMSIFVDVRRRFCRFFIHPWLSSPGA